MKLALRCPASSCKGYVAPLDASEHASHVVERVCRKCGARWRLVVEPLGPNRAGFAHRLDWTCIASAQR